MFNRLKEITEAFPGQLKNFLIRNWAGGRSAYLVQCPNQKNNLKNTEEYDSLKREDSFMYLLAICISFFWKTVYLVPLPIFNSDCRMDRDGLSVKV